MTKYDWVTDFMKAVQRDYHFYDKTTGEFQPISFHDEKEHTAESEIRHYREVCFAKCADVVQPINDEYVFYNHSDAVEAMAKLASITLNVGFIILGFRHCENDWSTATTIERKVRVNRLGWGIFVRKASLVIGHTYNGEFSSSPSEDSPNREEDK